MKPWEIETYTLSGAKQFASYSTEQEASAAYSLAIASGHFEFIQLWERVDIRWCAVRHWSKG